MDRLALVFFGGALGSVSRYLISLGALRLFGPGFPAGTLVVNVLGSFLIALINHVGLASTAISPSARLFLTTGVMGGLTTYSTFNYETLELLRGKDLWLGAGNVAVTVIACLAAGVLGLAAGRWLLGD